MRTAMNTTQTAKLTGIPEDLLVRMRARETRTLKGGPPYCRKVNKDGTVVYTYDRREVQSWMRLKRCLITAGDAAALLETSRDEILKIFGLRSIPLRAKGKKGTLIVDNGRNVYIWVPNVTKKGKNVTYSRRK